MSHPKLASIFNKDEKRVDWHDKALWFVRHKRDLSVHQVKGWESLRDLGHGIKAHTLSNLDNYLIQFEKNALENGVQVHWAADGNEHNNVFKAVTNNIEEFEMTIYNRWGEIVWESFDATAVWYGTYGSGNAPDGTYVWVVQAKENTTDKRILFFGEKGVIIINDNVEQFGFNPEINGSKNQEILNQYNLMSKRFQNQRLEFIKKDFEAKRANDKELIEKLEKDYKRMVRRRVLYTTNFALTNADSEVAPYIALTEMYDASLQMLDTVNNSLSPKIKASDYGKRFQEYLDKIKANEKK